MLCGLLPAWRASRTDGLVAFKGEIVVGTPRRRPLGLVAQVVMSFVLLLVAGTFVQALVRMQTADPGFAVDGRLYAYTFIPTPGITPATGRQIYSRAIDGLKALPGFATRRSRTRCRSCLTGSDCAARASGPRTPITTGSVDPGYFETMQHRHDRGPGLHRLGQSGRRDRGDCERTSGQRDSGRTAPRLASAS